MLYSVVIAAALVAVSSAAEPAVEPAVVDDVLDPRLFIITNTSDNNTLQYVGAAIGALVLFGLLLAVVLFAFGFFGNRSALNRYDYYEPDTYAAYNQQQSFNYPPQQGFQSRALGSGYSAMNVLMMLEEAFQKLEVLDFECQQRIMCEAHEAGAIEQYGDAALRLQKIIGAADTNATEGAAKEVSDAFDAFHEAAVKGIQQQDCQNTYAAKCAKGLRDVISKKF